MAHTPGPWKVLALSSGSLLIETDDHRCAVICDFDRHNRVNNEENARLIAAAPDLLEALKQCRDALSAVYNRGADFSNAHKAAGVAIAKAEGGE